MTGKNIVDVYCDLVVNQMFREIRYLQNFLQTLRPIMLSEPDTIWEECSEIEVLYLQDLEDDELTFTRKRYFCIEDKFYHKLSLNPLKLPVFIENLVYLKWALGALDPKDVINQRTNDFLTSISLKLCYDYKSSLTEKLKSALDNSYYSDPWVDEDDEDEVDIHSLTQKAQLIQKPEALIRENLSQLYDLFLKWLFCFNRVLEQHDFEKKIQNDLEKKIQICIWDLFNLLLDIPENERESALHFCAKCVLRQKLKKVEIKY